MSQFLFFLSFLTSGFFAALIVISWQCYKDPPWEGFSWIKLSRTFITAFFVAVLLYALTIKHIIHEQNFGIIMLTIMGIERSLGEVYKGFFKKKHEEYMLVFKHYGLGLNERSAKIVVGIAISVVIIGILIVFGILPDKIASAIADTFLARVLFGFLGGLSVALGGAFKDTTFEKFNPLKFMRSPFIGLLGGVVFYYFASTNQLLIIAGIGFERLFVDYYKTIIKKGVRGIFAGKKPAYPEWLEKRRIFVYTYLLGFLYFFAALFGLL